MNQITEIVDKQLKAYNLLDFETFSSCYHKNIASYDIESGSCLSHMCGESFFAHYEKKFKENTQIHCKVIQRMVYSNLVVDKEYITAFKGKNHHEMVIYLVEDELISKMWFTKEMEEEN